jgi:hypothetical protein
MAFTFDSKLGEIMADPRYVEIFEKYCPGLSKNPMVAMAKQLSIKYLLAAPQAKGMGFTKDKVEAMIDEINKLGE